MHRSKGLDQPLCRVASLLLDTVIQWPKNRQLNKPASAWLNIQLPLVPHQASSADCNGYFALNFFPCGSVM